MINILSRYESRSFPFIDFIKISIFWQNISWNSMFKNRSFHQKVGCFMGWISVPAWRGNEINSKWWFLTNNGFETFWAKNHKNKNFIFFLVCTEIKCSFIIFDGMLSISIARACSRRCQSWLKLTNSTVKVLAFSFCTN